MSNIIVELELQYYPLLQSSGVMMIMLNYARFQHLDTLLQSVPFPFQVPEKIRIIFLVWTKITFNFTSLHILALGHPTPRHPPWPHYLPLTALWALDRKISPWPHNQPLTAQSALDRTISPWPHNQPLTALSALDRTLSPWAHYQALTALSALDRTISPWPYYEPWPHNSFWREERRETIQSLEDFLDRHKTLFKISILKKLLQKCTASDFTIYFKKKPSSNILGANAEDRN